MSKNKQQISNEPGPPILDSRDLFKDRRALVILHDGTPYTLRVTSNNKLILTK